MREPLFFHVYLCNPEEGDQNFHAWAHSPQEAGELVARVMNEEDADDMGQVRFDVILCPSGSSVTGAVIIPNDDEVILVAEDLFS
jgi:hypothetical protein